MTPDEIKAALLQKKGWRVSQLFYLEQDVYLVRYLTTGGGEEYTFVDHGLNLVEFFHHGKIFANLSNH